MTLFLPVIAFVLIAATFGGLVSFCLRLSRQWLPDDTRRPLVFGPPTRPLDALAVRVNGDAVYVRV